MGKAKVARGDRLPRADAITDVANELNDSARRLRAIAAALDDQFGELIAAAPDATSALFTVFLEAVRTEARQLEASSAALFAAHQAVA